MTKERKKTGREKVKNPALKRQYNLKVRRDYIEPDYIDGVYNDNGELLIRALTDEEKEWLNKFYEETVCASFKGEESLYTEKEDRREIYSENNARNRCLYNKAKKTNRLMHFDIDEYDKFVSKKLSGIDIDNIVVKDKESLKNICRAGEIMVIEDSEEIKRKDYKKFIKGVKDDLKKSE